MVRLADCTSGYNLFQQVELDEDMAELTRLLYVAATRAGDYLVLSSGLDDLDRPRGPWLELLRRQFDLRTGMPLHSFNPEPAATVPAVAVGSGLNDPPRVLAKVILDEPPLPKKLSAITKRVDLGKVIENARKLAAAGKGAVPEYMRPVAVDRHARRQYSVSRLNGTLRQQAPRQTELTDDMPAQTAALDTVGLDTVGLDTVGLDALGLGTLVHAVLAELAGGKDDSPATIESLVRRHAELHLPDAGDELAEPIRLIGGLTASPRWTLLREATCVHTELEFLLAWPPDVGQISNLPKKEDVGPIANLPQPRIGDLRHNAFIQGFIDCLYQDPAGNWRLVDYKTNRISADTLPGTIEEYEMQMLLYALAVERVLDRPPVEIVLHFLRGNVEHPFPWNAAARRRAVELVDAAMESGFSPKRTEMR